MKILMITSDYIDESDAPSTHIRELAHNLSKHHEVRVIAQSKKNLDGINIERITVPQLPYTNPLFVAVHNILLTLNVFLIGLKLKSRYDVIYNRSDVVGGGVLLGKLLDIPVIAEINGILWEEAKLRGRSEFRQNVIRWLWGLSIKHADCIVVVTFNIAKEIQERYKIPTNKIVVIQNGANTDLFKPMNQKEARKELNLNRDANYVGFVGTLAPWQGVEYLIQSALLILKEIPNTKFLIVGGGQMKKELINLAEKTGMSDKTIFTGAVPYGEVPKYINASDVCVAPFIKERNLRIGLSPLKIYEYGACGKPIVSSRIPNLEFIEQQNAGLLVEPESPEEIAKAIIKLLKDEKLREQMGKNGREYVVKNHSWASVARRVADIF